MHKITEFEIEAITIELFQKLGYQYVYTSDIGPGAETPLSKLILCEV